MSPTATASISPPPPAAVPKVELQRPEHMPRLQPMLGGLGAQLAAGQSEGIGELQPHLLQQAMMQLQQQDQQRLEQQQQHHQLMLQQQVLQQQALQQHVQQQQQQQVSSLTPTSP